MGQILVGLNNIVINLNDISPYIPICLALFLGSIAASGTWRRTLIYILCGTAALILAAQWTFPITALLSRYPVSVSIQIYPLVYMLILIISFVGLLILYQMVWHPKALVPKNNLWFLKFIASGLIGWMLGVMLVLCIQITSTGAITLLNNGSPNVYQSSVLQSGRQVALWSEEFVPWQTLSFF